jgi:hypothetical protein
VFFVTFYMFFVSFLNFKCAAGSMNFAVREVREIKKVDFFYRSFAKLDLKTETVHFCDTFAKILANDLFPKNLSFAEN